MSEDKQTKMTSDANSDFLAVHEDVVKRVLETQPEDEYLYDLAELFKVFGDTTRLHILYTPSGSGFGFTTSLDVTR